MGEPASQGSPLDAHVVAGGRVPRQAAKRARETLMKVTEDIRLKDLPEMLLNPPKAGLEEEDEEDNGEWAEAGTEVGLAAYEPGANPANKTSAPTKRYGRIVPDVSREELQALFRYPAAEAAAKLGVPMAMLKKICRAHGFDRWPHQKPHQGKELGEDMRSTMLIQGVGGMPGGVGHPGALDFWNSHILAHLGGGQVPGQVPGKMAGQVPGKMAGQVPGQVLGQVPGKMPGQGDGQVDGQGTGHSGAQAGAQHTQHDTPSESFGRGAPPGMRAPPGMGSLPSMGAGMGMAYGYRHMANNMDPLAGMYGMPSISPERQQGLNHLQSDRILIQSLSHQVSGLKEMMEMINQSLLTLMVMMQDKSAAPWDSRPGIPQGNPFAEAAPVNQGVYDPASQGPASRSRQPGTGAGFAQDESTISTLMDQMRHLVNLHAQTKKGAGEPN